MFTPITEPMHIHSLNGQLRDATILDKVGDNKYIAEYEGVKCTAIYNPFVGRFYVDDKPAFTAGLPPEKGGERLGNGKLDTGQFV